MPRRPKVSDLTPTERLLHDASLIKRRLGIERGDAETSIPTPAPEPSPQAAPPVPSGDAERPAPEPSKAKSKAKPKAMQSKKPAQGRPPKVKPQETAKPRRRGRPPLRRKPVPKGCISCGIVKAPRDYHRHGKAADGRLSCCRTCMALRRRAVRIARLYPACAVLGVQNSKNGLRDLADDWGFDSAFELEVAARLHSQGVDVSREGTIYRYRDAAGQFRTWRPDFTTPDGVAIEVKGRLFPGDCAKIRAVLEHNPDLDIRLVLQDPHRSTGMGKPTLAEWADSIDVRWSTLHALERVTMDLPRVALTEEGDRIVPGWHDDGRPAERVASELWSDGGGH